MEMLIIRSAHVHTFTLRCMCMLAKKSAPDGFVSAESVSLCVCGRTDGRISPLSISSHYQPSTLERLWGSRSCRKMTGGVVRLLYSKHLRAQNEQQNNTGAWRDVYVFWFYVLKALKTPHVAHAPINCQTEKQIQLIYMFEISTFYRAHAKCKGVVLSFKLKKKKTISKYKFIQIKYPLCDPLLCK